MLSEKRLGRDVAPQLKFLGRFLNSGTVFMEVGPGDCTLSCRVAERVKQVYAVDVSEEITKSVQFPPNLQLCISDGTSIPVPEESVNVAYSDQLMEHLHPDDAVEQLHNIYRALAPGGIYLCVTPNRFYGPSDVSCYFDDIATGFHLREYSAGELNRLFKEAGFARTHFYVSPHGWHARWPASCAMALEFALDLVPPTLRRPISTVKLLHSLGEALLGLRVAGIKA
jgi:SAM-dependent methyltransferase